VKSKQGCNKCASEYCSGHAVKDEEEQDAACRMKDEAGEVVHAGVEAEEVAVKDVRQPCQRMPVCFFFVGETKRPGEARKGYSILNMVIFGDIQGVIIADEFMIYNLPVYRKYYQAEKQASQKI